MTKAQFNKEVKAMIQRDGAKAVDINTTFEKDGVFEGTYMSTIIAIRNHVAHRYSAWSNQDGTIECKYSACLGA